MSAGREILIAFGVDVDAPSFKSAEKALASLAASSQAQAAKVDRASTSAAKKGGPDAFDWATGKGESLDLFKGMGSTVAIVGEKIGYALANAVNQTAELGSRLNRVGTGFKADMGAWQGTEYALGRVGVSAEEATGTLSSLESKAYGAAMGLDSGAVMAFSRMGIRATKANGEIKKGQDILDDIAERLKVMPDTIATQQKTIALAGEGIGRQLGESVRSGRFEQAKQDVKDFGAALDDEGRASVRRYGDEQSKLGLIMKNLRQGAALPLIDSLGRVGGAITEGIRGEKGSGGQALATATAQFSKLEPIAEKIGMWLYKALPWLGLVIEGFAAIGNVLGTVVEWVVDKVVPAFEGMGTVLIPLGAAIFAAFFPITALFAAILVVLDDLITYSKGGDSLFGRMLYAFDKWQEDFLKPNANDPWWLASMKVAYRFLTVDLPEAWEQFKARFDIGAALDRAREDIRKKLGVNTKTEDEEQAILDMPGNPFAWGGKWSSAQKHREQREQSTMVGDALSQGTGGGAAFVGLPGMPGAGDIMGGVRAQIDAGLLGGLVPTVPVTSGAPGSGGRSVTFSQGAVTITTTVNAEGFLKEGIERTKKIVEDGIGEGLQALFRQIGVG